MDGRAAVKLNVKSLVVVAGLFFASPVGALSQVPACSAENVEPTTVAQIAASPERYRGRCVQVDGIRYVGIFYHDITALYRRTVRDNDPTSTGQIIGVDSRNRGAPPQRVRIIGRVDTCEARQSRMQAAAADDEIIMLSGYCHYFRGPVLSVANEQVLSADPPARLLRGGTDPALGDLSPLADGPLRTRFAAEAARIFALFEVGDRAGLIEALRAASGTMRRSDADAAALAEYLLAPASPLQAMRGEDLLIEVYGWREPLWADATWRAEQVANPGPSTANVCLAASPRDAALLPLSERDAHMLPGRPYGCLRMEIGSDDRVIIEIDNDPIALAEPPTR